MTHERAIYILENTAWLGTVNDLAEVKKAIRILEDAEAPTIEAEPERRGKWVNNGNNTWSCSRCNAWLPDEQHYYAHYCLFCGAKMERWE